MAVIQSEVFGEARSKPYSSWIGTYTNWDILGLVGCERVVQDTTEAIGGYHESEKHERF